MKRKIIVFLVIALAVFAAVFLVKIKRTSRNGNEDIGQNIASNANFVPSSENTGTSTPVSNGERNIPLDRVGERVSKKPFGIYITSQNSPVQPERFQGYHTGADYEILPGEENADVPVQAVCTGKLRVKQFVSGYGGVTIQDCLIGGENVTVLYGHLNLASIQNKARDEILETEMIGNLGDPAKGETDGERKHLHLGIRKESNIDLRGYVSSPSELADWIDPCLYFCR